VQHVAGSYRSEVFSVQAKNRDGSTFRRDELDLECIGGVAMHNGAHVALLETVVWERAAEHNRVMWLHR